MPNEKNKIDFPHHLIHDTPATIRVAFDAAIRDANRIVETGRMGEINISSVLTQIVQTVGRFAERWASDVLYTTDTIRTLTGSVFDLEEPIDEIIAVAVRKDGDDHNNFLMNQLFSTQRGGPYVHAEPYYRAILLVNVRVQPSDVPGLTPEVTCELRDATTEFLRIDPADLDEDGRLVHGPYQNGNPVPESPRPNSQKIPVRECIVGVRTRNDGHVPKLFMIRTRDDEPSILARIESTTARLQENGDPNAEDVIRAAAKERSWTWFPIEPFVVEPSDKRGDGA